MRESRIVPFLLKEIPIERGEQPGFRLRLVSQRAGFFAETLEGALSEISGVGFAAAQAERETIERLVIGTHDFFECCGIRRHVKERPICFVPCSSNLIVPSKCTPSIAPNSGRPRTNRTHGCSRERQCARCERCFQVHATGSLRSDPLNPTNPSGASCGPSASLPFVGCARRPVIPDS